MRTIYGMYRGWVRKVLLGTLAVFGVLAPAIVFGHIYLSKVWGFQSRTALMLGCEMMCETGPNFKAAANQHRAFLGEYSRYIRSRFFMRIMPNKYELHKNLEVWSVYLSETLESNDITQEKAARAIWQAGEEIVRFRMRTAGLSASEEVLQKKTMPPWLRDNIKTALDECKTTLDQLKKDKSSKTALKLCEVDRRAMLLLFLARSDSNISEYLKEFRNIVERGVDAEDKLSMSSKSKHNDDESELLQIFVHSEQRRLKIINAMLEPEGSKVYTLMWDAISQSVAERPKRLELAAKLNYGENLG